MQRCAFDASRVAAWGAAVLAVVCAGCAGPRPDPRAESSASAAIGHADAITFRTEGGPLDEPGEPAGTLSLEDAVRRAAACDPTLQAALARVRIAMADADQARLLPNPVLNFILRWGPGPPQIEVSLVQDLVQAMQVRRRSSAADNRLRQAAADAVTAALDTVAEVQERYIAVQTLESALPIQIERRAVLDKLVATAKARLEAQEGTRNDLTTLEVQRVELEVDIADSTRQLGEERLHLARLMGEPSGAATWRVDAWRAPLPASEAESRWVEAGLEHRPEVQSAVWALAALGDDAALARVAPWEGGDAGVDVQNGDGWFAGPSIATPIPIFDTGQAGRARVSAEQIEARHNLTLARRKVVEEVRVAYQSLKASTANHNRIRSQLIPLQEQRRQLAEDAYRAGATDATALFQAEGDLQAARAKAIDVEQQMSVALVRLQRAVGGPGIAASIGLPAGSPDLPVSPAPSDTLSQTSNHAAASGRRTP